MDGKKKKLITPSFFETPLADSLDENDSLSDTDEQQRMMNNNFSQTNFQTHSSKKVKENVPCSSNPLSKESTRNRRRKQRLDTGQNLTRNSHDNQVENMILQQLRYNNRNYMQQNPCSNTETMSGMLTNQQMKFIERLQQDIDQLTNQLNERDGTIESMKKSLHQKDNEIKRTILKHNFILSENRRFKEELDNVAQHNNHLNLQMSREEQEKSEILKNNERLIEELKYEHEVEVEELQSKIEEIKKETSKELQEKDFLCQQHVERFEENLEEKNLQTLADMENMEKEFNEKINRIEAELNEKEDQLTSEVEKRCDLKEQLQNMMWQINEKNSTINILQNKVDQSADEYAKLKIYIQQLQDEQIQIQNWKDDQHNQQQFIKNLEEEKQDLAKTLEVANIRFESVSKILKMQENAISNHVKAIPHEFSQNKQAVVTSQWREKVFELMIQLKSQEIVIRNMTSKHLIETKQLHKELNSARMEESITKSRLEDCEAQNQLKEHRLTKMEEKKVENQQQIEDLQNQIHKLKLGMADVYRQVKEFAHNGKIQSIYNHCVESCQRNEQRISFANNRLKTIRDLLKRKESRQRIKQLNSNTVVKPQKESNSSQQEILDLKLENTQLIEEQEMLRAKLIEDSGEYEKLVDELKHVESKYQREKLRDEEERIGLINKIKDLETQLQNTEQRYKESDSKKNFAVDQMKKTQRCHEKELDEAKLEIEEKFHEQLREEIEKRERLEREMAKSVLALRQTERKNTREMNQLNEQADNDREMWKNQERKLLDEICSLKKDNTILMASLRQEGILPRKSHQPDKQVRFNDDFQLTEQNQPTKETSSTFVVASGNHDDDDDIEEMLKNLNDLSQKVLDSD